MQVAVPPGVTSGQQMQVAVPSHDATVNYVLTVNQNQVAVPHRGEQWADTGREGAQ